MFRLLIFLIFSALPISLLAGVNRTSLPVAEVLEKTLSEQVTFKDRAKVHGYYSTQSCLFSTDDIAVFQHYCFPKRDYPARAFTLISKKFGMIHFYEEDLGPVLKRDIRIQVFPEDLAAVAQGPFGHWLIEDWNKVYSYFTTSQNPACWSTNYSQYTRRTDSSCYLEDISRHVSWSTESLGIVNDIDRWNAIFDRLTGLVGSLPY